MNIVTFINIIYLGSILGIVSLATIVTLNKQTKQNKYFIIFTYTVGLWVLFQFFTQLFHQSHDLTIILVRTTSAVSLFVSISFIIFVRQYLELSIAPKLYLLALMLVPFLFTNAGVKSIEVASSGIAVTDAGVAYLAVLLLAAVSFIYGFVLFIINYAKSSATVRKQNKFLIVGIFQAILFIIGGSIVFADNLAAQVVVPISIFILVLCIFFSIIKYQLFDIKALVARSFVYTITTTVLVTLYSAISLPIKNFLISINTESYISTIVEIVLLGIFGVSFYPLKVYFDRVTTKYFFRDHYNTQEVLRSINTILSDSVDLDRMLHRVGGILRATLHVEYCSFMINESDGETNSTRHINIGRAIHRVTIHENLEKLLKKSNVVITEQLRDDNPLEKEQKEQLTRQDIAGVVKLKGVDEHGHIENEGFLILGNKKSGRGFSGQDEKMLEILSGQFAVAIQNLVHLDEIVHFNIKLQEEVTDATKELKVKNKKLRELDQTKDEFVSMASHQLRTPLTSVKGYLSMVLDGDAGELKPAQKQLLDQAYISTQRMVYLIADLLNLSRLKTGKFMINPQPTNLAHMIEGEIHQIEQTAKASDLKVSFMCDPSIPDLMLDDMKTRQVIMNFIDNAIYYTPKGGNIEVYLEKEDGKAIFKVSDSGIGVAKEDQKELFGKFFRAGNARKARPDGTGLGLYMAKMVIDAQGGKILFSSQEGKGSTFGFSFDIQQLKVGADTQNLPVTPDQAS